MPRPGTFGVIGGPPCPDFSTGGKNRGKDGDRGALSQVYIDRVMELDPSFFLMENVPGLLRTIKHRKFLANLMAQLSERFEIDVQLLNALDHGAPQDRDRLFLLGFSKKWIRTNVDLVPTLQSDDWLSVLEYRNGKSGAPEPPLSVIGNWYVWPRNEQYYGAKSRYRWPDTAPFGEGVTKPSGIPDELMVGPLICNAEEIAQLPNGTEGFKPRSAKFKWIPEGDVSRKSFKRLHRWRYSPVAAYGNNEVHLHPTLPRRLTVREALRIQTVPDGYILPDDISLSSKFKAIGNGVPVKLARAIAGSICRVLVCTGKGDT